MALDPQLAAVVSRSVEVPEPEAAISGVGGSSYGGLLWYAGGYADAIPPWGTAPSLRDAQLRRFFAGGEPFSTAAFAAVTSKYSALKWKLEGDERTTRAYDEILRNANWGRGWTDFVSKLVWDLLTQDKGAFIEIVREQDSPLSPCIGIKTLDSAYCWHTGNPEIPVIYLDRRSGKYHRLKWYQVWSLLELPIHHEQFSGLQMSAGTRVLKASQIFKNVLTYIDEKTGGRHTKAIHIVSGPSKKDMEQAMQAQQAASDARLLERYMQPVIVAMMDPSATPQIATLELSALPEGWDMDQQMTMYLTVLALALSTDYGELAPLPGSGLGTATQSEVMDRKSKEKGVGLFQTLMTELINTMVLPANVKFSYDEDTSDGAAKEAQVKSLRAATRAAQIESGEIDVAAAREMAIEEGDISEEVAAGIEARAGEAAAADALVAEQQAELAAATPPEPPLPDIGMAAVDPARLKAEEAAAGDIAKAMAKIYVNVQKKLAALED